MVAASVAVLIVLISVALTVVGPSELTQRIQAFPFRPPIPEAPPQAPPGPQQAPGPAEPGGDNGRRGTVERDAPRASSTESTDDTATAPTAPDTTVAAPGPSTADPAPTDTDVDTGAQPAPVAAVDIEDSTRRFVLALVDDPQQAFALTDGPLADEGYEHVADLSAEIVELDIVQIETTSQDATAVAVLDVVRVDGSRIRERRHVEISADPEHLVRVYRVLTTTGP